MIFCMLYLLFLDFQVKEYFFLDKDLVRREEKKIKFVIQVKLII